MECINEDVSNNILKLDEEILTIQTKLANLEYLEKDYHNSNENLFGDFNIKSKDLQIALNDLYDKKMILEKTSLIAEKTNILYQEEKGLVGQLKAVLEEYVICLSNIDLRMAGNGKPNSHKSAISLNDIISKKESCQEGLRNCYLQLAKEEMEVMKKRIILEEMLKQETTGIKEDLQQLNSQLKLIIEKRIEDEVRVVNQLKLNEMRMYLPERNTGIDLSEQYTLIKHFEDLKEKKDEMQQQHQMLQDLLDNTIHIDQIQKRIEGELKKENNKLEELILNVEYLKEDMASLTSQLAKQSLKSNSLFKPVDWEKKEKEKENLVNKEIDEYKEDIKTYEELIKAEINKNDFEAEGMYGICNEDSIKHNRDAIEKTKIKIKELTEFLFEDSEIGENENINKVEKKTVIEEEYQNQVKSYENEISLSQDIIKNLEAKLNDIITEKQKTEDTANKIKKNLEKEKAFNSQSIIDNLYKIYENQDGININIEEIHNSYKEIEFEHSSPKSNVEVLEEEKRHILRKIIILSNQSYFKGNLNKQEIQRELDQMPKIGKTLKENHEIINLQNKIENFNSDLLLLNEDILDERISQAKVHSNNVKMHYRNIQSSIDGLLFEIEDIQGISEENILLFNEIINENKKKINENELSQYKLNEELGSLKFDSIDIHTIIKQRSILQDELFKLYEKKSQLEISNSDYITDFLTNSNPILLEPYVSNI
jgi:hypothetical protein